MLFFYPLAYNLFCLRVSMLRRIALSELYKDGYTKLLDVEKTSTVGAGQGWIYTIRCIQYIQLLDVEENSTVGAGQGWVYSTMQFYTVSPLVFSRALGPRAQNSYDDLPFQFLPIHCRFLYYLAIFMFDMK